MKCLPYLLFGLVFSCTTSKQTTESRPPNIIIMYTDDQGYGDVGVFGAKGFQTPNLDQLANEGMRFTDFYVSQPVCTSSRASLLTGCYANRIGLTGAFSHRTKKGIHKEETTIAEVCKSKGYATAIFGKWHLGLQPQFLPPNHGFDEYYGIPYSNDMWPYHPDREEGFYATLPLIEGLEIVNPNVQPEDQTQFTQSFTERAVSFINRKKDEPFFLYLAHPQPHVPLFASDKFKGQTKRGLFGDVISEIDWSMGQILQALRDQGIEEKTLIIFASDNGPWIAYGEHGGSSGPLREGKGTTYEGGIRVPCIMRWPGKIPAASNCKEPVMTIDILPTIAGLIGAELPKRKIDGLDIWPLMAGESGAKSPHEALYFYYKRNELQALRAGKWKLVFPHEVRMNVDPQPDTVRYRSGYVTTEPGTNGYPFVLEYPMCGLELYDLEADIGEQHDLAKSHPEIVERLQTLAEKARADLGDKLTNREGINQRQAAFVVSAE
ncbi:MAG: sulfatase [Bacteroidota bacterium]